MPGRAGKYQRPGRQLDKRQVNSGTVRDASYHPQITITFGHEKRDKVAVDFDGAVAALGFRTLDLQSVFYGFFYRSLDPQRLSGRISPRRAPVNAATATIGNSTDSLKP